MYAIKNPRLLLKLAFAVALFAIHYLLVPGPKLYVTDQSRLLRVPAPSPNEACLLDNQELYEIRHQTPYR